MYFSRGLCPFYGTCTSYNSKFMLPSNSYTSFHTSLSPFPLSPPRASFNRFLLHNLAGFALSRPILFSHLILNTYFDRVSSPSFFLLLPKQMRLPGQFAGAPPLSFRHFLLLLLACLFPTVLFSLLSSILYPMGIIALLIGVKGYCFHLSVFMYAFTFNYH